jgi:hypothetical protein
MTAVAERHSKSFKTTPLRQLWAKLNVRLGSDSEINGIAESSSPTRQLRTLSHRWTLDFRSAEMLALRCSDERDLRPTEVDDLRQLPGNSAAPSGAVAGQEVVTRR